MRPTAAVQEKRRSVRPIAVGEVLRRLAAMFVLKQAMPDIQQLFPPVQLGVGVSDAVTHLIWPARLIAPALLTPAKASCKLTSAMSSTPPRHSRTVPHALSVSFSLGKMVLMPCGRGCCSAIVSPFYQHVEFSKGIRTARSCLQPIAEQPYTNAGGPAE